MNGTYYTVEYREGNERYIYYTNTNYRKIIDFFHTCNGYENNLHIYKYN